jgi:hypothetical protein
MPLLYPIASNPRDALNAEGGARTIAEARELSGGPVALVADWLRPLPEEREEMQAKAEAGIARGFVQIYEDAKGHPVIAVSYWKPGAAPVAAPRKPAPEPEDNAPVEDHTDDLYFTKAGARAKRKKKALDPNQMDLFGVARAAEADDSHGPGVVIVEDPGEDAG